MSSVVKTELDLFTTLPLQTCIQKGLWVEYQPLSSLESSGPVEFHIPGSSNEYIDIYQTQLMVKGKIVKKDKNELDLKVDKVAPVNLFLHSLFSQVDLYLNDKMVTSATNLYSYRSYLETVLNYSPPAKQSQLSASLWSTDSAGAMDDLTFERNDGAKVRIKYANDCVKSFEMLGPLHLDMCFQEKLLPNGVSLKIRMIRNKPAFYLMSDTGEDYTFDFEKVCMYVRKVVLSPECLLAQTRVNIVAPMKYPCNRVVCRMFTLPAGFHTGNIDNAILGTMPRRLVLGLLQNSTTNGNFKTNPYNFKHYDLNYLCVQMDGEQFPSKALQPDYANKLCIRSYMSLFTGLNVYRQDSGNGISKSDYMTGYTLYAFDLSPDLNEGGHVNVQKQGSLRVEMTFKKPLPHTVNCLLYCEYENLLQITSDRQILTDF